LGGEESGELVVEFTVRVTVDPNRWPAYFGMPEGSTGEQMVTARLFDHLRTAPPVINTGARIELTASPFGPYDPNGPGMTMTAERGRSAMETH